MRANRTRSVVLPDSGRAAQVARTTVTELLTESGLTDPDVAYTAVLLASELAANAWRHARTATGGERRFHLEACLSAATLRVRVSDSDHAAPALRPATVSDTDGRGLNLIQALAKEWGVTPTPGGKSVWFVLDLPG